MSNFTPEKKVVEAEKLFHEALSLRQVANLVGIAPNTAARIRAGIPGTILCPCGKSAKHNGWCSYRFSKSQRRQLWMSSKGWFNTTPPWVRKLVKSHPPVADISEFYPYSSGSLHAENDFVAIVDAVVSKALPNDVRADVSQDLLLALVAGTIAATDIKREYPHFLAKHYRRFGQHRNILSLDAPLNGTPGASSLYDLIAAVDNGELSDVLRGGINYRTRCARYERVSR